VNLVICDSNGYVITSVAWKTNTHTYIYTHTHTHIHKEPKTEFDCSLWLRIPDKPVCMSHYTFILHYPAIHPPFFLSSILLIMYGGRYNLRIYTLDSFLQFPFTFSHKILSPDQNCSQTQFTAFPQCHRPSVTSTVMKILYKHTHTRFYFNSHVIRGQEGEEKFMKL